MIRGGPSDWGLGVELITTHHKKNRLVTKHKHEPRAWRDSLDKRPKGRNMDMRLQTWNIRNLYRAGSLVRLSKEL
jgi:hypothetical protein